MCDASSGDVYMQGDKRSVRACGGVARDTGNVAEKRPHAPAHWCMLAAQYWCVPHELRAVHAAHRAMVSKGASNGNTGMRGSTRWVGTRGDVTCDDNNVEGKRSCAPVRCILAAGFWCMPLVPRGYAMYGAAALHGVSDADEGMRGSTCCARVRDEVACNGGNVAERRPHAA